MPRMFPRPSRALSSKTRLGFMNFIECDKERLPPWSDERYCQRRETSGILPAVKCNSLERHLRKKRVNIHNTLPRTLLVSRRCAQDPRLQYRSAAGTSSGDTLMEPQSCPYGENDFDEKTLIPKPPHRFAEILKRLTLQAVVAPPVHDCRKS